MALWMVPALALAQAQGGQPAPDGVREVQVANTTFARGDPTPTWVQVLALPPMQRRNPVVIRLADSQFRVSDAHEVFVDRALQVNDSASLGRIGQYAIHFVPDYQRVRLHYVHIIRGGETLDRTRSTNIRFLQREAGLESGVYSGGVTASLLIDDVRVGDTMRVAYTMHGSNPVFGNTYFDSASWDSDEPIDLRRAVLLHPTERPIQWRMVGDFRKDAPKPDIGMRDGMKVLQFEQRGLDGIDAEPYVPDSYQPWRFLQFSEYRDWNQVARWANGLFPPSPGLPAEARALVQTLRAVPDPQERVLRALQWVQQEIRYFSVSMGESSHRPHDPQWVLDRRYGDCKDKTYLLVTLLRELGLEAQPMLVSLRARRLPAKLLPAPDVFDHAIVRVLVDGKNYYLDGTRSRQTGRLDNIGLALDGGIALVVAPEAGALLELVSPQSEALAINELSERITLAKFVPEGQLEMRQVWRGAAAEGWRIAWARWTPEQRRKVLLGNYERRYPGIEHVSEPVALDDPVTNQLTISASFRVPKLAQDFSGDWVIRFSPAVLRGLFNLPNNVQRNFPLETLPYPLDLRYALSIQWPDNVSVVSDPQMREVRAKGFRAEVSRAFRGSRFDYSLRLQTIASDTPAKEVAALLDDIKRLEDAVGGVSVVERKSIKDGGFLGIGADTVQSTMRKRSQDVVTRTTATISAGRLSGDDLAEALCDRAESLADLGKGLEGLADANEAVRISPASPRAAMCRGNLQFNVGEFARAITDYGRALSLGHAASEVYYHRALARFYSDQIPRAAEDFARAAQSDPKNIYPHLWHLWSLQRAGLAQPPELLAIARKEPRGDWPRPALAMLAGVLQPEEVLAIVQRMQGDERELNMTEALFYIGQYHMVNGRTAQARESFERTRAKGITMFIEHVAAGFELARPTGN